MRRPNDRLSAFKEGVMAEKYEIECLKCAIADYAIATVEKYRVGSLHGREVLSILGPIFNASNDVVEKAILDKESQ